MHAVNWHIRVDSYTSRFITLAIISDEEINGAIH